MTVAASHTAAAPARGTVIRTNGFHANRSSPQPTADSPSGFFLPEETMSPMTARSMARMTSFSSTNARVMLFPAVFTTPHVMSIHTGPYTLVWLCHLVHGIQESAQNLLGRSTYGLAPCTACIRP